MLRLQGQRKAIDDAEEEAEERKKARVTWPQSLLPESGAPIEAQGESPS